MPLIEDHHYLKICAQLASSLSISISAARRKVEVAAAKEGKKDLQSRKEIAQKILEETLNNDKKQTYEPIHTEIVSLGTGAGTVDSVKPGGLVAIGTKLDPTLTRGDSLLGSIVGKPDSLPDNSNNAKLEVNLFDSAVGSANEEKITPIKTGENLRVNIGTAPILGKVTNVKSDNIELSFKRPVCLFEKSNVALSRRISDRWRLIGAGIVG